MAYLNEMIVSDSESGGNSACTMLFRRIGQNPCVSAGAKIYVHITKLKNEGNNTTKVQSLICHHWKLKTTLWNCTI